MPRHLDIDASPDFPIEPPAIVARQGTLSVLARTHEVMWRDGTAVQLHPVLQYGVAAPQLRAVFMDGQWIILDLSTCSSSLGSEIRIARDRDVPGLVYFTLRHLYRTAAQFLESAAQRGRPIASSSAGGTST